MHPHTLHALIAAHSLAAARVRLDAAVHWERRDQRRNALTTAAAVQLQAWRPTIGRAAGGHGDPVGSAVLAGADAATRPLRPGRLSRLQTHTDETLDWLASALRLPALEAGLPGITAAIPRLDAASARELGQWLAEADTRVRTALSLGPAREQLLAGVECPACQTRLLHAQELVPGRPVVCRAEACRCAGDGCGCGMSALVEGLVHVWACLV